VNRVRRHAATLRREYAEVRFRRETSTATKIGKDRCPPNRAVHRRGLERRVCTVEPPFIGPRVIDRRPQSDVIGAALRLATGEAA
jgi:hypothetical protein